MNTENDYDLKPCPLCGGKAYIIASLVGYGTFFTIYCEDCDYQTDECCDEKSLVEWWNKSIR